MPRRAFLIFISVVLGVYSLVSYYIYSRGALVVPVFVRPAYLPVFVFLSSAFLLGRLWERAKMGPISSLLIWIGSFWLACWVYLFLAFLFIDLLRLINLFGPFFPAPGRGVTGAAVAGAVATVVMGGYINAKIPRVRRLVLGIDPRDPASTAPLPPLELVVVSDIHLGTIVNERRLERIVRTINRLKPDLVLLPGDVVDEDIQPVIARNLGETLKKIDSKLGVFAATGNHEYLGDVTAACRYLDDHGVTMLRDEVVEVGGWTIIGREDRSLNWFGKKRKSLDDLLRDVDASRPIILMDHQPFHLEEASEHRIELQLSGHTHHGQLWPVNHITRALYEVDWGYRRKGATHIYVSCGAGTWGPPIRVGTRPEIVSIRLNLLA